METQEAAPVAADAVAMPETQEAPQVETPVNDAPEIPVKAEPTSRDAIERAFEKLERDNNPQKEASPDPIKEAAPETTGPERNPDGTFKAKEVEKPTELAQEGDVVEDAPNETAKQEDGFTEPPNRFSNDAKAIWKDAPLAVRAEVDRAFKELESGIDHYRQAYEPFAEFHKELEANGQDFNEVVGHYRGIEEKLASDPIGGLEQICQNLGITLNQVAAHVTGQTPDQAALKHDQTISQLRNEISELKKGFTGINKNIEAQSKAQQDAQTADAVAEITKFSAANPRFDELQKDMAFFIQNGRAKDLQEAYGLAERLNPAQVQVQPAPVAQATQQPTTAQTRKGDLSLSGAPSSGSNPANKKRSASTRESLDNAFATVGM